MKGLALAVAAATAAIAALTAAASPASSPAAPSRVSCGVENWSLKTLTDPQRGLVRLRARNTTIRAINRRPMPHPTPTRRDNAFERQVWRVRAQIVEYKAEEDGDIHIVLFDRGAYMIAEMPAASCLTRRTRARRRMIRVRRSFESRCGVASSGSWRQLGAVAYISGVGFWDFAHGQRGHARNYAELHPVTGLSLIAGCS
jgi:hypothetical protein